MKIIASFLVLIVQVVQESTCIEAFHNLLETTRKLINEHYLIFCIQRVDNLGCQRIRKDMKWWSSPLYSSFSFDDDETLNWDEDDEDDIFDIQYDDNNLNNDELYQDDDWLSENDTDDTYYENLFKKQKEICNTARNQNPNISDDTNTLPSVQQTAIINTLDTVTESSTKSVIDVEKNKISTFGGEGLGKTLLKMKDEVIHRSKVHRLSIRRTNLEETARILALRALRQRNLLHDIDADNKNIKPYPLPSLSKSYSKSKLDQITTNENFSLEEKMYGSRFQLAFGVYTRLLETIDEIKSESKDHTNELLLNRAAFMATKDNHETQSITSTTDDLKRHQYLKNRMKKIINLSLNGHRIKAMENHSFESYLDSIETKDLTFILKVRGNYQRRAKFPKTRRKLMALIEDSLDSDIF